MPQAVQKTTEKLIRRGIAPGTLNTEEAAAYVGLSPHAFTRDVANGILPGPLPTKSTRKRWSIAQLDDYLRGRSDSTGDPIMDRLNDAFGSEVR